MSEALCISKEWLLEYYIKKRLNAREVAEEAGCSSPTIRKYLEKFNIPVRNSYEAGHISSPRKPYRDKRWIHTMYEKKKFSIAQIGILGDCDSSTIRFWMREHGIKSRTKEQAYRVSRKAKLKETYGSCWNRLLLVAKDFRNRVKEHGRLVDETTI